MARTQRISANAILELKTALTAVFWYRKDLHAYASASVDGDPEFLAGIDWFHGNKRDSVDTFVTRLVREQDERQHLLLQLLIDVSNMEEFPGLEHHEEAATKIAGARATVARLRKSVEPYERAMLREEQHREQRDIRRRLAEQHRATSARLVELKAMFYELVAMKPHPRGIALEGLVFDLLEVFDLDPRRSYSIRGEQIDGGFRFENTYFVVECKWEADPTARKELDVFDQKVKRKADNTFGLFVSIQGFQSTAIELHSARRSPLILADHADLLAVLEERIALPELLGRKCRHAAHTGEIFLPVARFQHAAVA